MVTGATSFRNKHSIDRGEKVSSTSQAGEPDRPNDDQIRIFISMIMVLVAVGTVFALTGTAKAVVIAAVLLALTSIVANFIWGHRRPLTAIAAVLIAVGAGSAGAVSMRQYDIDHITLIPAVAPKSPSSTRVPVVSINVPEPARPGNPPPKVGCVQGLQGTARLPSDETLLIGNAVGNSGLYFYVPVSWERPGKWTATGFFGTKADTGSMFNLIAVVVPKDLAAYLVAAYNNRGHTYLAVPGLPPSPMHVAAFEKVRRSSCV